MWRQDFSRGGQSSRDFSHLTHVREHCTARGVLGFVRQRWTVILPLAAVVGVIVYLFAGAFNGALEYYVTVAELQAAPPADGRVVKVGGRVQVGSLRTHVDAGANATTYDFIVQQGDNALPVSYIGFVPDTFHESGEVVVTGRLRADRTLVASQILAKCASKYEAKK